MTRPGSGAPGGLSAEVSTDDTRQRSWWLSRVCIAAALLVAVGWQGGVDHRAVQIIWALAAVTWLASLRHLPTRSGRTTAAWVWLGLGGYTLVQLLPLPRGLVEVLHPSAVAISDAGRAALGAAPLSSLPLAIAPADAAFQGALYLVAGSLASLYGFGLMRPGGRANARYDGEWLGWVCAAAAVLWTFAYGRWASTMIPVGLRNSLRNAAMINPNHLAGICALGLAFWFGQMITGLDLAKRNMRLLVSVLLGGVALLTGSRGGVLACVFVAIATLALRPVPTRRSRVTNAELMMQSRIEFWLKVATGTAVAALCAVPFVEAEILPTLAENAPQGKTDMLRVVAAHIGEGWLFGQAPGSLPVTAGLSELMPNRRIDFAENLVLQRFYDQGLWGALPFFGVLAWLFSSSATRLKRGAVGLAPWFACAALLLQNLADFSLEIAGGLVPFLIASVQFERLLRARKRSSAAPAPRTRRYRLLTLGVTGLALASSGMLLANTQGALSRASFARLGPASLETARADTLTHFSHDFHAFFLLCRKTVEARQLKEAKDVCNRAVALRPESRAARLLRFAAAVDLDETATLNDDLRRLLSVDDDSFASAVTICGQQSRAATALVALIPELHDRALAVGKLLVKTRPDLVEQLALRLREVRPQERNALELLLGRLYLQRGHVREADAIATGLIAQPKTKLQGWSLQADIFVRQAKHADAFVLYEYVCRETAQREPCVRALSQARKAMPAEDALQHLRRSFVRLRRDLVVAFSYWIAIGHLQYELKQYRDAVSSSHRALGLLRNDPAALQLEAKAYLAESDWRAARRAVNLMPEEGRWGRARLELAHEVSRTRAADRF